MTAPEAPQGRDDLTDAEKAVIPDDVLGWDGPTASKQTAVRDFGPTREVANGAREALTHIVALLDEEVEPDVRKHLDESVISIAAAALARLLVDPTITSVSMDSLGAALAVASDAAMAPAGLRATIEAKALRKAADEWDDPERVDVDALAHDHYRPGGPSMPAVWLRLRASALASVARRPDTPQSRADLTEAEWAMLWSALRRITRDDGPVSVLHERDQTHARWAVAPAVAQVRDDAVTAARAADRTAIKGVRHQSWCSLAPTGPIQGEGVQRAWCLCGRDRVVAAALAALPGTPETSPGRPVGDPRLEDGQAVAAPRSGEPGTSETPEGATVTDGPLVPVWCSRCEERHPSCLVNGQPVESPTSPSPRLEETDG